MKDRRFVLGAALAFIGLPVVMVPIEAIVWFSANADNGSFVSSGFKRDYLLYVPKSYDRSKPTPLIISLHGGGLWGSAQKDLSQFNRVADREGFLVVYPDGMGGRGVRSWGTEEGPRIPRDVKFIAELIDTVSAHYHIDPARIYANGLSNGGGFSFVLSCTLSDRIAAVGLVASAQFLPWKWCTDRRPVPMINFHGTSDSEVPYTGGTSWVAPGFKGFPGQLTWTANWAQRNRCAPAPRISVIAADVTRRVYTNCANNADVQLYTVHGGGHTWPGGGKHPEWFIGRTSHSIDASSEMWAFFREHPLVATRAAAQEAVPGCGAQGSREWLASRPSPLDSTTLKLGNTIAKICYSRPSLRGRTIESLLPLGVAWRTGANEPATLTITSSLNVGGAVLAPGRYVILTVPKAEQWILAFHTTPDSEPGKMFRSLKQVGMGVGPIEHLREQIEQFTIRVASDNTQSAFILEWGDRRVRIPVRTIP